MTNELKSLTLNGTKYDSFVDETARATAEEALEAAQNAGGGSGSGAGITITSTELAESTEDGGKNTQTIKFSDGSSVVLTYYNGNKGKPGDSITIESVLENVDGSGKTLCFSDDTEVFIANGADGYSIYYADVAVSSTLGNTTVILVDAVTVSDGRAVQAGDLIISSNLMLCQVNEVSETEYTVDVIGNLKGTDGDDAIQPAFEIGTVTTLEAGSDATVELEAKTETDFKFNFGIPKGADGSSADGIPDYWQTHLESKVVEIRQAMETAGRNKSAFLWYTDIHWNMNYKQSPKLLKYLYENTPINKTNFGGDVVQDEPTDDTIDDTVEMSYVYDWRKAVRCLPNHHSVVGNHDDGSHINNRFTDECIYSYLLAAEENNNVVYGENFYYYIDDKTEKTRYIYLDTAYKTGDDTQAEFLVNSLKSTPEGWHIVAIAHIWHDAMWNETQGDYLGDYSVVAGKFLKVMYDYNHRASGSITVAFTACAYDFSDSGGKVEFCIGGHIHWDNVSYYNEEIPVILTETDSTRERVNITAVAGTITENSVNAVIADYKNDKVSVVRVGRGSSFVVSLKDTNIVTRHSIVQNLTNVSSSNTTSSVAEGDSFETTLTVTSGTLTSIVVTMGGEDVTNTVYAGGTVTIPSVTGTVVITAIAEMESTEPDEPTYTNVLLTAEAYDSSSVYNGKGYKENVRPSTSSGTGDTACSGMSATGYIPYNGQTTLRMKNMGFKTDSVNVAQCVIQSWSSKTVRNTGSMVTEVAEKTEWAPVMNGTTIEQVTLPQWFRENCAYIRICCDYIGADSIITLDEPIE